MVQVTAPPFAGAALRTAKLDAVPREVAAAAGKALAASATNPNKLVNRNFWRLFMK